ncbi:MAG TPA: hypothetical protein VKC51_03925 [Lacunisphaera sp.]|nr:hypothetical protein [Lacunisphaera sp.]
MRHSRNPQKGSLILVVLCLLAVLGIGLAAYLAVGNQSMKLSDRSNRTGLSEQLAELGLEEAMRAFNKNDWSGWTTSGTSATWTISGTTATCNLAFPATKFGQGVTGSVKIRIDNYNAAQLDSIWSSSANYRINDLVGYNGIWYRCVQNHSNQTPGNLAYWVQAPIPWTWSSNITYSLYNVVNYNGTWYRCILAHTSSASITPTSTTYWSYIPKISLSWSSGTSYPFGTMLFDSGKWYYCILAHTSSAAITSSNTTYWAPVITASGTAATPSGSTYSTSPPLPTPTPYLLGDYIYRASSSNAWFRCIASQPYTYASGDYGATSPVLWVQNSIPYISWAWRSGVQYSFNDRVFYSASGSGTWYRCKIASANSVPTTSSDWEVALTGSMWSWSNSSVNYSLGDAVYYSTTSQWYRCILAHTSSGTLTPANTTYWSNAPLFNTAWDSNKQYSQNDTVRYNGVWYLALSSNTGTLPATNPGTWALAPASLAAWDSTKYYNLNDTVSYSGTWYRCILPHTNQTPTNTTYWSSTTGASRLWSSTTAYTTSSYVCYDGVWYKCLVANTGQSPNNTTYWTAAWAQPSGVTTGPPVIYAEGTVNIVGSTSIKTQLRATIAPAPLFPNAAAATTIISANSGGTVDSYDGSVFRMDTAGSPGTAGTYSTYTYNQNSSPFSGGSPNLGYSAVLAAGSTITLGSTAVKGYLAWPSPPAGIGGSVKGPSSPGSPNIDLTRISRSPYIPQFDTLPSGGLAANWATTPKGTDITLGLSATTNIGTPGATTPSRYYINGDLDLSSSTGYSILNINGPVILYINGDLIMDSGSPNGRININTTGSAEIHIAGSLTVNLGSDGFYNTTQDPKRLILICDTSASSVQNYSDATNGPSGTNPFYGVIYLPNTTNASGLLIDNNNLTIYGAISAKKITYSGANANIHYDTSLRYATFGGVDQPYAISEWRELTDATELATMP